MEEEGLFKANAVNKEEEEEGLFKANTVNEYVSYCMSMPSRDYAHFRAELPQELSQEAKSSHGDYDLSRSWPGVHRGSWVAVVRGCCCSCLSRMDPLDYEFHSYPSAFVSASLRTFNCSSVELLISSIRFLLYRVLSWMSFLYESVVAIIPSSTA